MLLQRVSLTHNVRLDGVAVRQLDTGDLTLGGVGLFRLRNEDLADDTLTLRAGIQERRLRPVLLLLHVLGAHALVQRHEGG